MLIYDDQYDKGLSLLVFFVLMMAGFWIKQVWLFQFSLLEP